MTNANHRDIKTYTFLYTIHLQKCHTSAEGILFSARHCHSDAWAQSFLKLPFLPAHWTLLLDLLRVEPFEDAMHMETVGALAPDQWTIVPRNLTCNILEPAFYIHFTAL